MDYIIQLITLGFAILFFLMFLMASVISLLEKEKQAAGKFLWLAIGLSLPYFITGFTGFTFIGGILSAILILALIIILFPFSRPTVFKNMAPNSQFDERDTMFARKDLEQDSENFKDYLRSTMSYCNAKTLEDFIGKAEYIFISNSARKRFEK